MDDPQNQPVTTASTDQPLNAPSPGEDPAKAPEPKAVEPMFHDPKTLDPALKDEAMKLERRMQGGLTKHTQALAGKERLLEQVESAMANPQVARMFAEELLKSHGIASSGPGKTGSPESASDDIPDNVFENKEDFGRYIKGQVKQGNEETAAQFRSELAQKEDQIQKLELKIAGSDDPLVREFETDIHTLRMKDPNLTQEQAVVLATHEARQALAQNRAKEENEKQVREARLSYSEESDALGEIDEPVKVPKGATLMDTYRVTPA